MNKKRLRLKKLNIHPIIAFILLTFAIVVLSGILYAFQIQVSYSQINMNNLEIESKLISVENLLNYQGIKYMISNAAKNFASFTPLSNLLLALIGLSVAYATGLLDTFTRRITWKIDNKKITFIIIFLATISSIINDVGYVILIPLSAIIFSSNKRNPILGIIASFCGIAFGYGATLFAGSAEVSLIPHTTAAARIVAENYHVQLTSNIYIMIISTIILSVVGTIVIEKIIAPKIGRIKVHDADGFTKEIDIAEIKETEHNKIEIDAREKKGLRKTLIFTIIYVLVVLYMLIPGLPFSGLLLDLSEKTYIKRVFGDKSYFQDGFTFIVSVYFVIAGIVYGKNSKGLSSFNELVYKCSEYLKDSATVLIFIFFAAQFTAIFKKTNIGTVIVAFATKLISELHFTGIPLLVLVVLIIAFCGLFITTPNGKWAIIAPIAVPVMMQSNISPQFAQFILRAADSMTKGITPLLAYFVIYLAYLNVYNTDSKPITIKKAISYVIPYFLIISLTWILIIVGWYILGAPIGIGVNSTL